MKGLTSIPFEIGKISHDVIQGILERIKKTTEPIDREKFEHYLRGKIIPKLDNNFFETYYTGTLAKIIDWDQGGDGLLGITTIGTQKFRLKELNKQEDGLNIGSIERIEKEGDYKPLKEFTHLVELLQAILDDVNIYGNDEKNFDSSSWISYRFAEILPLRIEDKQKCLEIDDPIIRLNFLEPLIKMIRESSQQ